MKNLRDTFKEALISREYEKAEAALLACQALKAAGMDINEYILLTDTISLPNSEEIGFPEHKFVYATPLGHALLTGYLPLIELCYELEPEALKARTDSKYTLTPLMYAVMSKNLEVVKWVLEKNRELGISVNETTEQYKYISQSTTPTSTTTTRDALSVALQTKNRELMFFLMTEAGAVKNPNIESCNAPHTETIFSEGGRLFAAGEAYDESAKKFMEEMSLENAADVTMSFAKAVKSAPDLVAFKLKEQVEALEKGDGAADALLEKIKLFALLTEFSQDEQMKEYLNDIVTPMFGFDFGEDCFWATRQEKIDFFEHVVPGHPTIGTMNAMRGVSSHLINQVKQNGIAGTGAANQAAEAVLTPGEPAASVSLTGSH